MTRNRGIRHGVAVVGILLALGLFAACSSSKASKDTFVEDDTGDVIGTDTPLTDSDVVKEDTPSLDVADGTDAGDVPTDPGDIAADPASDPGSPPGGTWTDPFSGLVWQDPPNTGTLKLQAASDYCDALTLANLDDWRLPSVSELRSLIRGCPATVTGGACGVLDSCLQESCNSTDACASCTAGQGPGASHCYWDSVLAGTCGALWSSSADETNTGRDWIVDFSLGSFDVDGGQNLHLVRCVRGGPKKLGAPTITAPLANASVSSPLQVQGTGEPNAIVAAKLLNGDSEIGSASANAAGTGAFDFAVAFTDVAAGTTLTLSVTQTMDIRTSAAATVSVKQKAVTRHALSGTISQTDGATSGTVAKVRLYANDTEAVQYLQEAVLTVVDGSLVSGVPYTFQVPNGSYTVRAFRDVGGSLGRAPDGEPTLGTDPQAPGLNVVVSDADVPGKNLLLVDTASAAHFNGFDVFTINETAVAEPPIYTQGGASVAGTGLCRGYHLMLANGPLVGTLADLTAPSVVTPSGARVALLDDGGCGSAIHDNTNHSYDMTAGDNQFSLGIPDPDATNAGRYVCFYRNTALNMIHNEVDDVAQIVKLSRHVYLTSPTGAAHSDTLTPTFTWTAIGDANAYSFVLTTGSTTIQHDSSAASFTLTDESLADVTAYDMRINPRLESGPGDVEATALGIDNYFITDVSGTHVITLSGTIVNDTGSTADRVVFASDSSSVFTGGDGFEASAQVTTGTTFSLELLKQADCSTDAKQSSVRVLLDVDGAGDPNAAGAFVITQSSLPSCSDTTDINVTLRPRVEVLHPHAGATAVGDTPTTSWEAYETTYSNATGNTLDMTNKSYLIYFEMVNNSASMPPVAYALPNSTTSFNFAALPTHNVDVIKVLSGGTGTSATNLSGDTQWRLFVGVIECTFGDSGQALTDYSTCLQGLVAAGKVTTYAQSPSGLQFSTH